MTTLSAFNLQDSHYLANVTWVHHWTEHLFSFRTSRPPAFRFRSGEFVMLGLPGSDKPLMRAYSIASPSFADELEFFSIKVPDGRLTSRLQQIKPADMVLLGKKTTGTLVIDALKPGKSLYLISTGTGLAPFLSIIKDFEVYERYERIIITHTVRREDDLAYREFLESGIYEDEVIGDAARKQLIYYPTLTQEQFKHSGRITHRIASGEFFEDLKLNRTSFCPDQDRVLICGSMPMIRDTAAVLEAAGMSEGSNARPGEYALERAFVG